MKKWRITIDITCNFILQPMPTWNNGKTGCSFSSLLIIPALDSTHQGNSHWTRIYSPRELWDGLRRSHETKITENFGNRWYTDLDSTWRGRVRLWEGDFQRCLRHSSSQRFIKVVQISKNEDPDTISQRTPELLYMNDEYNSPGTA